MYSKDKKESNENLIKSLMILRRLIYFWKFGINLGQESDKFEDDVQLPFTNLPA